MFFAFLMGKFTFTLLSRTATFHKFGPGKQGIWSSTSGFIAGRYGTQRNSYGVVRYSDYQDWDSGVYVNSNSPGVYPVFIL